VAHVVIESQFCVFLQIEEMTETVVRIDPFMSEDLLNAYPVTEYDGRMIGIADSPQRPHQM
jgi:hypothetical protein